MNQLTSSFLNSFTHPKWLPANGNLRNIKRKNGTRNWLRAVEQPFLQPSDGLRLMELTSHSQWLHFLLNQPSKKLSSAFEKFRLTSFHFTRNDSKGKRDKLVEPLRLFMPRCSIIKFVTTCNIFTYEKIVNFPFTWIRFCGFYHSVNAQSSREWTLGGGTMTTDGN